jgi:molybdopterin molybdotransferase
MLSVAEAQDRIWAAFDPLPAEWVTLDGALGRTLASDLAAKRDQPALPVSAMDGYAVRAVDTLDPGRPLRVVTEIAAGMIWDRELQPGEAARIFTGAVVPAGADTILIQENASTEGAEVRALEPAPAGRFVRPRGLDFTTGWRGLPAGRLLDPLALGLAAAMGHVWLPVRRRPRIGLLATGDELRWPGETPGPGQLISSNTTALAGFVRQWGGEPVDLGISPDRESDLLDAIDSAAGLDLLVTSGGASVGDYDLIQPALKQRGLELDFWKIAMRPGKPLIFGRLGPMPVIGFPGNPVSSSVCAIVFLRGAMQRLLGRAPELPVGEASIASSLPPNDQRQDYLRATLDRDSAGRVQAHAAGRQDSSMFATMASADALIIRPPHAPAVESGALVPIVSLREIFH